MKEWLCYVQYFPLHIKCIHLRYFKVLHHHNIKMPNFLLICVMKYVIGIFVHIKVVIPKEILSLGISLCSFILSCQVLCLHIILLSNGKKEVLSADSK